MFFWGGESPILRIPLTDEIDTDSNFPDAN